MTSFLFRGMAALIVVGATMVSLSCGNGAQLRSITVLPANIIVAGAPTIIYTAIGHYVSAQNQTTKDLTTQVTWSTSTPAIVAFSDSAHPNYLIPTTNGCGANIAVTATLGQQSGGKTVVGSATVNVQCDTGTGIDFALSSDPTSVTASAGSTATYTIQVLAKSGTPIINLSASSLPTGATATFVPPSLTGTGFSKLTIQTLPGATGSFHPRVVGTDASGTLNLAVNLTIT